MADFKFDKRKWYEKCGATAKSDPLEAQATPEKLGVTAETRWVETMSRVINEYGSTPDPELLRRWFEFLATVQPQDVPDETKKAWGIGEVSSILIQYEQLYRAVILNLLHKSGVRQDRGVPHDHIMNKLFRVCSDIPYHPELRERVLKSLGWGVG